MSAAPGAKSVFRIHIISIIFAHLTQLMTELIALHLCSITAELWELGRGQVCLTFICHPVFLQRQKRSCDCGCFSTMAERVGVNSSVHLLLSLLIFEHYGTSFACAFCAPCVCLFDFLWNLSAEIKTLLFWFLNGRSYIYLCWIPGWIQLDLKMWWQLT